MDFEKWAAQQLKQVDAAPDDYTWAQIAAQQSRRNKWLRLRHYGAFALPAIALLILALAGWWMWGGASADPARSGQDPAAPRQEIAPENKSPIADLSPAFELHPEASGSNSELQTSNFELQTSNSKLQTPNSKLQTPNFKLQTSNFKLYGTKVNTVPAAAVRFRAEAGLDYESPVSGTRVHIPANTLVDAGGMPVQGEVELVFREYRGIADYIASGIPMHYADERGSFFFNSGGMFEVRINQHGETLQMAPGQTYDLTFSPTDNLTQASLYYFDDGEKSWKYRPDPAFDNMQNQNPGSRPPIVSEAQVIRDNTNVKLADCLPEIFENPPSDPAGWITDAVQTGYNLAAGKAELPKWFRKNPHMNNEQLLNSMEKGRIRVIRDRDRVDQFFPEDLENTYTELKAFKDCYFMRSPDSTSAVLRFATEQYWERISVVPERGNTCLISFYSEKGGLAQIYADLTASAGNNTFDAGKVMAEYTRLRDERLNNFEDQVRRLRRFLVMADMFQTEPEWCMANDTWLEYFENNHPMMLKRYGKLIEAGMTTKEDVILAAWNTWRSRVRGMYFDRVESTTNTGGKRSNSLTYALKLTSFGLYNCDQIFRLSREKEVDYIYAGYETKDGQRIVPASVSVMERASSMFFTLPDAAQMLRIPGRRLAIVVTDRAGRSYILPGEQYAGLNLKNLKSNTFTVEDVTEKARTPRDWAELLDM